MQTEDSIELQQQFLAQRNQPLVGGKWHMLQCVRLFAQSFNQRAGG
jgi:hypothetical protein